MLNNMMVVLLSLVLLCSTELLSQDSKNDLFAQLRKRYGNMNSLEVKFIGVEPISGMKGTLKAMRSGKYMLELSDRKIISDGHTIWNYQPSRKNVTINEIKNRPSNSLDIVLFNFLYNYQPKEIQEYTIGNTVHHGLELIPKNGKSVLGIKSLTMYVKKGSSEIKRISAMDGNQKQVWEVESLTINGGLKDAHFTFTPPKDAEIIDMR
ncbi:MAG: LolA family protein [Ignavibacteria bacterium]